MTKLPANIPTLRSRPSGGGRALFMPSAHARDAKRTLRRVLRLYLSSGKSLFAAGALTAFSSAIAVAIPYFVGRTFQAFHPALSGATPFVATDLLLTLLMAVAALYAANWLITTLSGVIMLRVSQKLVFSLRGAFFDKMRHLPLAFYDTRPHGDTMSRLTNDVDNISSTIAQAATQTLSAILILGGSLAVMATLSLPLTFTVLLTAPLVALLTRLIAARSRRHFMDQQRNLGALNGVIEESILGLKMVKAFSRQADALERFDAINARLLESSRKAQIWSGFMMPIMNVINNIVFALVALTGGILSAGFGLPVGTVISFLNYSKLFSQPFGSLAGMFNTIQSALAGAERVFEILDLDEETPDAPDAPEFGKDLPLPAGDIVFDNVSFSYSSGSPVLKNVSFHIRAGETVALVGETGAGKTTIVNLLSRFYDPDAGRILIDGEDIRRIRRDSLRRCFSVVLQDTRLFTGTIMDNIRYSRPDASDDDVVQAAKLARAHSFIEKLPNGYLTMVSGSADTLSQGQRQLLAIARAALGDRPILILDEATSSVDTKTEKDIQRTMLELTRRRTSLLVAHRLSTIRDADLIMVVGDGGILESGCHQSLMAAKGRYYAMVVSQTGE